MKFLAYILNRIVYIFYICLYILSVGGIVVSLLSYDDIIGVLLFFLLFISMPILYQIGLDYFDFENGANMFELDDDEENEK